VRWLLGFAVLAIAAWLVVRDRRVPRGGAARTTAAAARATESSTAPRRRTPGARAPRPPPPIVRSLAGTQVDGELVADHGGRLVITRETRRVFDYYLTAEGETPAGTIRALVVAEARRALPAGAADEAVALFDRYLEYRARGAALLESQPADPLAAVVALQRKLFGARATELLFGDDDRALADALAGGTPPASLP